MDDLAAGRSIRMVRIRRSLRQADVAALAGVSRATVSRIERGRLDGVPISTLRSVGQALGLRVTVQLRGSGAELDRLLGARHSAMHEAIARLFADLPEWVASPEVTFAIYREQGSIDVLAWHAPTRSLLVIELKTELVDVQDTLSVLDRKVRLAAKVAEARGWVPATVSAWLVVAEGPTNRRHVAAHASMLRAALPADGRTIAGWLRKPSGRVMALSFLSDARPTSAPAGFSAVSRVATRRHARPASSR